MIQLKCKAGEHPDKVFVFETDCVILGRGQDCTLCLEDDACSRYHARILESETGFRVTDLESKNGVRVNGASVKEASLSPLDELELGHHTFVFLGVPAQLAQHEPEGPAVESMLSVDSVTRLCTKGGISDVDELQRVLGLMQSAQRLSQKINATVDLEDLHGLIAESIFESLQTAERVCLFLKQAEKGTFELVRSVSRTKCPEHPVSRTLLKQIEEERVSLIASDAAIDVRFATAESVVFSGLRSLMLVPLIARDRFFGAIYVENLSKPGCFKKVDLELLTLLGAQAAFAIENALLYNELQRSFYETIRTLGNTLEAKDRYTHGHSERVARFSTGIARTLGFDTARLENVRVAAELHDIGKIAIPEAIIGKSGKLTPEELEAIKKHPELGVAILEPIRFLKPVAPFILYHHERYGGGGYPEGLKGTAIPLEARIIGLADAFDAMTSQRPYNKPLTRLEALERCRQGVGTAFDPDCVEALEAYLTRESADEPARAAEEVIELQAVQVQA